MDTQAARRARQKQIQMDLAKAYTDEEASPPEWVDLLRRTIDGTLAVAEDVASETTRFVEEPDIRKALSRRDRFAAQARARIDKLNTQTRRLNLIAPNARFTRPTLDADEVLRPLYRTERTKPA
jgi:hypothetical protein